MFIKRRWFFFPFHAQENPYCSISLGKYFKNSLVVIYSMCTWDQMQFLLGDLYVIILSRLLPPLAILTVPKVTLDQH